MTSYTIKEIDELRRLCEDKYLFGWYVLPKIFLGQSMSWSRSYIEEEKIKAVEEMVRTFMIAGKKPQDFYED